MAKVTLIPLQEHLQTDIRQEHNIEIKEKKIRIKNLHNQYIEVLLML